MNPLVISCSLNPDSRSARLAGHAHEALLASVPTASLVDLRQMPLPICDGGAAYQNEKVASLTAAIQGADPILLAVPVYNYDANAAAKNMIELTGRAWTGKVVGLMCTAGGQGSYMSVMPLANSLMLDFRCLIVPRFVYATGDHFDDANAANDAILVRTRELCQTALELATAIRQVQASPTP
jgi:NAD(P)H-dependent FMN reductase